MTRFPKLRSLLINLLVVIISCLVALLILEGVVRLTTTPVYPLLQTDAAVGTIHIKNFEGRVWNDESKSENYIVTNNDGYIGPNYALKKASTTYRIALLGDSMTEGVQVDWYRTFGHVFEDLANVLLEKKSGMHIEAMNFGVGGTGTFLQYQTYKQNVAKY